MQKARTKQLSSKGRTPCKNAKASKTPKINLDKNLNHRDPIANPVAPKKEKRNLRSTRLFETKDILIWTENWNLDGAVTVHETLRMSPGWLSVVEVHASSTHPTPPAGVCVI